MSSASPGSESASVSRYQPEGLRGKAAVTAWLDVLLAPAARPRLLQIPDEAEPAEEAEVTAVLSPARFAQPMVPGVPVEHEVEGDRYATRPARAEAIIWPIVAPQIIDAAVVERRRIGLGRHMGRFTLNIFRKVPSGWWPVGQPL